LVRRSPWHRTADHCTRLITMANGQHRSAWVALFEDGREDDDILTMGMESAAPVDTALIFDAYNNDAFWLPTSEKPQTGETTDHGLSANGPEPFTAGCSTHGLNGTQQGTPYGFCSGPHWPSKVIHSLSKPLRRASKATYRYHCPTQPTGHSMQ
jgi:hypothetical protein